MPKALKIIIYILIPIIIVVAVLGIIFSIKTADADDIENKTITSTSSVEDFIIINDTIVGYNGVLPNTLNVPSTYSLKRETKTLTFINYNSLQEFFDYETNKYSDADIDFD